MTFVYIILAILVLELLIFVHELGHFTAGKLLGFRILGFSLGFGPALFKFKRGETEYALRAIPFGGACQFDGEDEEGKDDPRRFNSNPVWKRLIVIFAGPFMNILTAYILAFIIALTIPVAVPAVNESNGQLVPIVHSVNSGSAAERAGILPGDVIIAIDGTEPQADASGDVLNGVTEAIQRTDGDLTVTVGRDGKIIEIPVTGAYDQSYRRTILGITMNYKIERYEHYGFFESFGVAGDELITIVRLTGQGIGNMFKNGIHRGDVSGVVGTVGIMVDFAREDLSYILQIACILSLSLGLFNLIPFPALDGGRILFLIIEAIIGRPLNRKVEAIVNGIGFALLFGLMIVVTVSDVIGLIGK
ncbi:MAG: site-2 protease family protein [Clostridia bacterium]|nr:site-2 protease family protein [Clostridia bacterium]